MAQLCIHTAICLWQEIFAAAEQLVSCSHVCSLQHFGSAMSGLSFSELIG